MGCAQAQPASFPMRPVEFGAWLADVPKHFVGDGDLVMSHVFAVLSSTFPEGEAYFVRSVRAVSDRIEDPKLRREVDAFVGQESMHGREHRMFNDRLAEMGYPVGAITAYVRKLHWLRERFLSEHANVGVTAALEHYTATLAETMLGDPQAQAVFRHRGTRYLFLWHALEEAEHKAVAFDVFRSVGGRERTRLATMWLIHLNFILETLVWTAVSLAMDPAARRHPLRVLQSLRALRRSPFLRVGAVRHLFDYHRRGFHPDDHDSTGLISRWRAELFGTDGVLAERLAG